MVRPKRELPLALVIAVSAALAPSFGGEAKTGADAGSASQPAAAKVELSKAERIVRLEQSISDSKAELEELRQELDDPQSEYAQAKREFAELDKKCKELEKQVKRPATDTQPADPDAAADLEDLRNQRELAKQRFELAIKEDTAGREKLAALEKKLLQDREALAKLRAPDEPASQPAQGPGVGPAAPDTTAGTAPPVASISVPSQAVEDSGPESSAPEPGATPSQSGPGQSATPRATPEQPGQPAQPAAPPTAEGAPHAAPAVSQTPPTGAATGPEAPSKELVEAQKEAQAKQAEAAKAQQEAQSVEQRMATLRQNIQSEQELLQTARDKAQLATKTYNLLREQVQKKISEGAPAAEIDELRRKVDEAETRAAKAEGDVTEQTARVDELQSELLQLQSEQIAAAKEAKKKTEEATAASKKVEKLKNPFSLHNILQWLITYSPRVLGILLAMAFLLWLTRIAENRIMRLIAGRGEAGTESEREARAKTLASVFKNVASTVIIVGGVLMILTAVDVNIVPLLGAAGVVGLAVAFGAQALIKDYFSGFIVLLENQYAINDVVKIGDTAGLVERITLRMTVLRDLEGNAHFVPHGEIKHVTNMTHGWSRALFDIGVAYKEQVDQVMEVLMQLGRELRRDPAFAPLILDDPEMLGVDNFADSAVVIKFFIKTRPLRQWTVKRELLRRIKNRFDELGIEIPFPHRTLYLHQETNGDGSSEPHGLVSLPSSEGDRGPAR